jgi:hypothetical protein
LIERLDSSGTIPSTPQPYLFISFLSSIGAFVLTMKFACLSSILLASFLTCHPRVLVSAQEEEPPFDDDDALTIFDIVAESPDHTSLAILLEGALPAVADALTNNANSTYTLFAPDDTALSALAPEAFTLLLSEPWIQQCTFYRKWIFFYYFRLFYIVLHCFMRHLFSAHSYAFLSCLYTNLYPYYLACMHARIPTCIQNHIHVYTHHVSFTQ